MAAFVGAMPEPLHAQAQAQAAQPDPTTLDPNAPMDAMPDLGVEWPDMNAPDPKPEPEPAGSETATVEPDDTNASIDDSAAARHYVL